MFNCASKHDSVFTDPMQMTAKKKLYLIDKPIKTNLKDYMSIITRTDAFDTLRAYHKLQNPASYCIINAGKECDGINLYRIVDQVCCPLFRTYDASAHTEHEEVLIKLVCDLNFLYSGVFPTLLSSYPSGFLDYLAHSNLREKAIEVLKSHGADISDLERSTK